MNETVLKTNHKSWCELILNRPAKLNVLNDEIIGALRVELEAMALDDNVKRVFLTGAGPKGFCAGGDVVSVVCDNSDKEKGHFFKSEYEVDQLIHNFKKPIVALCHGIIMGGGVGLVNGCRVKVFDSRTLFAMPEITIGFFPDVGSSYFLNKLPKKWCLFLALTGGRLSSAMSHALGLCDYVVDQAHWDKLKDTSCEQDLIAQCEGLHATQDFSFEDYSDLDVIEGMNSIEEFHTWASAYSKEDSANEWIKNSLKLYLQGSPLSAKVIWHYFNWARNKSIESCFDLDYQLGCLMLEKSDFKEGVRALLIDKDKSPQWMFEDITSISQEVWGPFEKLFI